jgi:hypothetical protein
MHLPLCSSRTTLCYPTLFTRLPLVTSLVRWISTHSHPLSNVRAVVCQIDNQFWQQPGQNISPPEVSGSTDDASELILEVAGAPKVGTSESPEVKQGYSQGVSNLGGDSLDLLPPSILPTPSIVMSILAPPPSSVLVASGSIRTFTPKPYLNRHGKLQVKERERQHALGLCMYCACIVEVEDTWLRHARSVQLCQDHQVH